MRVTRYTDYALRVLIYAALNDNRLCTIREIADQYEISKNHLMKVVQELAALGYLEATRGRNGGLRLGAPAERLSIGKLVREMETEGLVDCFRDGQGCVITPACELKRIFAEAHEAFFKVLDRYSVADILPPENREQLVRLLGIDVTPAGA